MKRIVILCLAALLLAVAFPLLLAQPETAAKPEAEGASLALARLSAPPVADGDPSDWQGIEPVLLDSARQWKPAADAAGAYGGPADLRASVRGAWDDKYFYLALETEDNALVRPPDAKSLDRGDAIMIDVDAAGKGSADHEFLLALLPMQLIVWRYVPAGQAGVVENFKMGSALRQVSDSSGERTRISYEVAIPWTDLPPLHGEAGARFGLSISFLDDDGTGRKGWLQFTRSIVLGEAATGAPAPTATTPAAPAPAPTVAAPIEVPPLAPPVAPPPVTVPPAAPAVAPSPTFPQPDIIRYDSRSFILNGHPTLLLGGSVEYYRIPRREWADRLQKLRDAGANLVTTFVPWNYHEQTVGKVDLRELEAFLDACKAANLWVILRPGPHIGAGWAAGGFPDWLIDRGLPLRSDDPSYLESVRSWLGAVFLAVAPRQITKGGPVIAIQLEQDYRGEGTAPRAALERMVEAAGEYGIQVPLLTNQTPVARELPGLLDTASLHPLWAGQWTAAALSAYSHQAGPVAVTELYTGTFGGPPTVSAPALSAVVAAALAGNAALVNLYLGAGGTNFGYWAEPGSPPSYDDGAPIAEGGGLRDRYYALRDLAASLRLAGEDFLAATEMTGGATASDSQIVVTERAKDTAGFLLVRLSGATVAPPGEGEEPPPTFDISYTDPATKARVRLPAEGEMTLGGAGARLLPINYSLEKGVLVSCTSALVGRSTSAGRTVLTLAGTAGEPGELRLRWPTRPVVLGPTTRQNWDQVSGVLTVGYAHADVPTFLLVDDAMVLVLTTGAPWEAAAGTDTVSLFGNFQNLAASTATAKSLQLDVDCRPGQSILLMQLPKGPRQVRVGGKALPVVFDSATRTLAVNLTTPEFTERPKSRHWTRQLARFLGGEPQVVTTYARARFRVEELHKGDGWRAVTLSPLSDLNLPERGFIRYRTTFEAAGNQSLALRTFRDDPKLVFVNGKLAPALCRPARWTQAEVSDLLRPGQNNLDVLYQALPWSADVWFREPPNRAKGLQSAELLQPSGEAKSSVLGEWLIQRVDLSAKASAAAETTAANPPQAELGFDDSGWESVTVGRTGQTIFEGYPGTVWFRSYVTVPENLVGALAIVDFGGVNDEAIVYVNGVRIGDHAGADSRFSFDISPYLNQGENVIALAVRSSRGAGGGIVRPVTLTIGEATPTSLQAWEAAPDLYGEAAGYAGASLNDSRWRIVKLGPWRQTGPLADYRGVGWHRLEFAAPDAAGWNVPYQATLAAADRGLVYLNGRLLGLYEGQGQPVTYYLPTPWLSTDQPNAITLAVWSTGGSPGLLSARVEPIPDATTRRYRIEVVW